MHRTFQSLKVSIFIDRINTSKLSKVFSCNVSTGDICDSICEYLIKKHKEETGPKQSIMSDKNLASSIRRVPKNLSNCEFDHRTDYSRKIKKNSSLTNSSIPIPSSSNSSLPISSLTNSNLPKSTAPISSLPATSLIRASTIVSNSTYSVSNSNVSTDSKNWYVTDFPNRHYNYFRKINNEFVNINFNDLQNTTYTDFRDINYTDFRDKNHSQFQNINQNQTVGYPNNFSGFPGYVYNPYFNSNTVNMNACDNSSKTNLKNSTRDQRTNSPNHSYNLVMNNAVKYNYIPILGSEYSLQSGPNLFFKRHSAEQLRGPSHREQKRGEFAFVNY